jgi:hypothetical protein
MFQAKQDVESAVLTVYYSVGVSYLIQGYGLSPIFKAPTGLLQDPMRYIKWFGKHYT